MRIDVGGGGRKESGVKPLAKKENIFRGKVFDLKIRGKGKRQSNCRSLYGVGAWGLREGYDHTNQLKGTARRKGKRVDERRVSGPRRGRKGTFTRGN